MKVLIRGIVLSMICVLCLSLFAGAADGEFLYNAEYCFSEAEFSGEAPDLFSGIFVTAVPEEKLAQVKLGGRNVCVGDVLCADVLEELRLHPVSTQSGNAVLCYRPIYGTVLGEEAELTIRVCSGKNETPKAENAEFETYKNIANEGKLQGTDPEEAPLSFLVEEGPKRGSVKLEKDGSFVYTPDKNKIGEDSFTFTVTDEAGNVSAPATVRINILKPADAMSFADLEGSCDSFEAMWMGQQGLMEGSKIGGVLCFEPEEAVTRSEFLLMVMKLYGIEADESQSVACFADQKEQWLQPYLTAALRTGIISGEKSEKGLVFRGAEAITQQEAAVMLQNVLQLPVPASYQKTDSDLWARTSIAALCDAGLDIAASDEPLSRMEAAKLLYEAEKLR